MRNFINSVYISALIVCFMPTFIFAAESIKVGYFDVPPHIWRDKETNKITGAIVEFFEKLIAPEMKIAVLWEERASSIPRQYQQLQNNQIDVGIVFAKNQEREKFLNYPSNHFIVSTPTLVVLKKHPLQKVDKVEDILNFEIGYGKKAYISPFMRDERIKFRLISSPNWFRQNFEKLLLGKLGAIYMPELPPVLFMAKNLDAQEKIRLVGLPESSLIYTAFSKNAKIQLSQRYDIAFKKVGGRNMYLKILAKYIDIEKLH